MPEYIPIPIVSLETPRLLLRPVVASDAGHIQAQFANLAVLKYMATSIPWPYPETGAEDFLAGMLPKMANREVYFWAILQKDNLDQGMVGQVGITPQSETDNRGFWLAERLWGRGYMSEVVLAVTDFGFGPLGMKQLILNNAQPNLGSHRLKEKAGAEIVSIEDRDYIGGRFPGVTWRLTAEQWAANRHRFLAN